MLRNRLAFLTVGLSAVWLNASPFTVDGLNYEKHADAPYGNLNTVALTGATSSSIESLTVPATVTYDGVEYYVDFIHPDAFDNYSNLRSVRFEDSPHIIQSIGWFQEPYLVWPSSPFQNCPIEEYYIGRDIIYKSNELNQLVLESTAESVSITFAGEITYLSSLPFYMHSNTTSQILPRLTSLSLGGTIKEIKAGTFADAVNLKNLTILPGNAIDIRTEMFAEGQVFDHVTLEGSQYGKLSNIAYTGVTLGGAYLTVPERMFYGNKLITNVILSEGVAKIGNSAFMGCDNLTSITFPSTLEEIDSYAFNWCKQLQNVTFNEGLKKIGLESFVACEGFDRLVIPGSVEEISSKAFFGAWNVNEILIEPAADGSVLKIGTSALGVHEVETLTLNRVVDHTYANSSPLHLNDMTPKHLVFGEGWETIPESIRKNDKYLQSVTLPSTVRKIGNSAFMGCDSLISINFPSSLEEIDSYAFNSCKQMPNVTFNEGLKKIGVESFQACEGFDRLVIPGSVEEISSKAFFGAWNVNEILIEPAADGSVLKIGTSALGVHEVETLTLNRVVDHTYANSSPLHLNDMTPKHMIFGEGWETIPESIRKNDKYLQSVTLPSTVRKIGNSAFMGCDSLTSINFPSTLEEIDSYAFNSCKQLPNVTFNEGLKKIGLESFVACEGFDRLVIPGSVEEISDKAFFGAWNVNEILIEPAADGSVLKIGTSALGVHEVETLTLNRVVDHTYANSSPLHLNDMTPKHLVFGEGWETIPESIRKNDKYLQSVTLPSTVRKIGNSAFMGCDSLISINFPSTLEEIDSYAFNSCKQMPNVTFNEGLKKIGLESFVACEGFDRLVIPGSVEEISSKAFFGAWNVNEILIEPAADGSVLKIGDSALGVHEVETLTLNRVVDHTYGPYSPSHLNDMTPKHLVFGEGWETIPERLMANRDSLMSVTLPASLTRINTLAFSECPQLEAVTVQAPLPPECGAENVFAAEIFPVATLYVPNGSRALYEEAFVWRNFSNIAVIGNPVISVNYNAEGGTVALNGTAVDTIEVEPGDRVELTVTPAEGYELTSLTINGDDAIELLVDGLLVIDSVEDSMQIEVVFGLSSGVDELTGEISVLSMRPGVISVSGMAEGSAWQIYDIAGALVYSGNDAEVAVAPGLYVVRIAGRSHRVMVR